MNREQAGKIADTITKAELAAMFAAAKESITDWDAMCRVNNLTKKHAYDFFYRIVIEGKGREDLYYGGVVNSLIEFGEYYPRPVE